MSTTAVTYPIVMALKEAEKIVGRDREWNSVNQTQTQFLRDFFALCRNEKIPEIESLASWDAKEINAFLASHGFSIRADDPFPPRRFGTASVLDLLVEWIRVGSVVTVNTDSPEPRSFPGVHQTAGVSILRAKGHANPIARLQTKSADVVFMTEFDRPKDGLDLVAVAEELTPSSKPIYDFEGVVFPMVSLDHRVDISWMEGLHTVTDEGVPVTVEKALQQTRLRMNECGARAESAVLLRITGAGGVPRPPLMINQPFLIWFIRPGLAKPLFVGHITEDDWQNPGDLTKPFAAT